MTSEILRAGPADAERLAAMLGRAFEDDPVQAWLFPRDEGRRAKVQVFFDLEVRDILLPRGEVWTSPGRESAAGWMPPGQWKIPMRTMLRHAPALLRVLGRRTMLALRGLGQIEARHPREPHWYLAVLGTDPVEQGRGLGSSVLAPVLGRCDDEGLGAYLESSKEENLAFYSRHGFEVTEEVQLPNGPPVWLMWRDPQPGRG